MKEEEAKILRESRQIRDTIFRDIYETSASDPQQWLSYARSLRFAANVLKPTFEEELQTAKDNSKRNNIKISIGQIYLMIVGFSVENYLKGIYVTIHPEVIENNKLVKLNTHSLLQLMKEIKFEVTKIEIDLIERLEEFVLWAGRYPIPAKFIRLIPKPHRKGTKYDFLIYSLPTDIDVAAKLIERLDRRLEESIA